MFMKENLLLKLLINKNMHVYLGSDHGGFKLKEALKKWLEGTEYKFTDLGCFSEESVDYPSVAREVCEKVLEEPSSRGLLVCGTGIGMSMVANKFPGIRAALCTNEVMAQMAPAHNNAQIIFIGGGVFLDEVGVKMLEVFLKTNFSGEERHKRRIEMMMGK